MNYTAVGVVACDDAQLMTEIESGSSEAFEELYSRYCDRAFRLARWICRDAGRAEDAVQEAFLSVWRSRTTYRAQHGSVATWLLTVVRYRAIDVARRNGTHATRRAGEDLIEHHLVRGDVADEAVARADADRLYTVLDRLPQAQREVIALAFYGGLTHIQIATHLGLPTGTVKGRMRLGLRKLRADVEHVIA